MDLVLAKIFATALVFSQVATEPSKLTTKFDETRDVAVVSKLLRAGCAHMRKAFDVEDLNLDDLIATAMADVDALTADQAVLRGINIKDMHVAYRQFCKNENVRNSPINLAEVIRFYNETLADLPSSVDLASLKPPGVSTVLDATGERVRQRRAWVPIDRIPLLVQQAFIAAEDKRFYEHKGVDERALVRAFIANFARAGRLQGGSTITQQVVKNLLVGSEVAYERKMREMVLASRLESSVEKSKILELYLNSIYLGRGSRGIEMASQSYFGMPATELDVTEAALLASLAKGPSFYNPARHPTRSRDRISYVLGRLHEDGVIDAEGLKRGLASLPPKLSAYEGLPQGSHFSDYIAREGKAVANLDLSVSDTYTVQATLHPKLQRAAESALQEGLSRYERSAGRADFEGPELSLAAAVARIAAEPAGDKSKPAWQRALEGARLPLQDVHWPAAIVIETGNRSGVRVGLANGRVVPLSLGRVRSSKLKLYDVVRVQLVERKGKAVRADLRSRPIIQGSVVVLDNQTGRILAMAGGFSYSLSQLNRASQSQRQPGSSIKPLVYLAALQGGLQPNTLVRNDAVTYQPIGGSARSRPEDFWTPKNYDGSEGGILTMRQALEASKNLPTARLLDGIDATPPQSLDQICKLALEVKLYKDCMRYYPFVLGAQPVRPIDMATFYATIANEGLRPTPHSIETISRNDDEVVYRHEKSPEEVTSADRASFYQLKAMLQGVLARGTANGLSHMAPYVAGKTGTTTEENDAWFVGFSNEVTVAVWVGYDNADGRRRTLGAGRTGGNVAIPIFAPVMQAVWAHYAPKTVLKPASPEARRHLAVPRREKPSRRAGLLPEYLRKDDRGRTVDARYRLLSRKDRDAYAATTTVTTTTTTQPSRRRSRAVQSTETRAREMRPTYIPRRENPRSAGQGFGWGWQGGGWGQQNWTNHHDDTSRSPGGRGFW
ncbi:MAG: glycosyl transferase [Rhizobiales bacterium]|nr:glycosyl transferase [Hyphomicrobiales bacterium]